MSSFWILSEKSDYSKFAYILTPALTRNCVINHKWEVKSSTSVAEFDFSLVTCYIVSSERFIVVCYYRRNIILWKTSVLFISFFSKGPEEISSSQPRFQDSFSFWYRGRCQLKAKIINKGFKKLYRRKCKGLHLGVTAWAKGQVRWTG